MKCMGSGWENLTIQLALKGLKTFTQTHYFSDSCKCEIIFSQVSFIFISFGVFLLKKWSPRSCYSKSAPKSFRFKIIYFWNWEKLSPSLNVLSAIEKLSPNPLNFWSLRNCFFETELFKLCWYDFPKSALAFDKSDSDYCFVTSTTES